MWTVVAVVSVSIVVHGITGAPLTRRLHRETGPAAPPRPEVEAAPPVGSYRS